MRPDLVGNYHYGILHGGVISSVMDMAAGVAVLVAAVQKHPEKNMQELGEILGKSSTIDLHVQYVRPGKGKRFFCKAKVTHSGTKISFVHMELLNQDELLIATGAATFRVSS